MMSDDQEKVYAIEKIIEQEIIDGKPHYLIKWVGFSATQSTWEPIQNLIQALDIVHKWKSQRASHTKKIKLGETVKNNRKTKPIDSSKKGHILSQKKVEKQLNQELKKPKKSKKGLSEIIIEDEESTNVGDRPNTATHRKKVYDLEQILDEPESEVRNYKKQVKQSKKAKIKLDREKTNRKEKLQMRQKSGKYIGDLDDRAVQGFKVVGKINRQGIDKVLWCFDWEDQKICEVRLIDGKIANMKREDVQRICPQKLCEYLQKVVDFRQ